MPQGREIIGIVRKISYYGYSTRLKLLKLNKKGLSYYTRDVPKKFEFTSTSIKDIQNDKDTKPKYCIPLDKILAVSNMTDKERTYYKKFFKDRSDGGFKVIFDKRALKSK